MRRVVFLAICTMFTSNCDGAMAQSAEASTISECILANAPKVEQAIASLPEATEFLVGSVCIVPITNEQRRIQQLVMEKYRTAQRKICDTKKAEGKSTKIGAGEDSYDPCDMLDQQAGSEPAGWTIFAGKQSDPAATALAAKTLLDLRLSKLSGQSH
jgi:hypothetical protein